MADTESLTKLCKSLGKKKRVDVLNTLSSGSYRNVEIAHALNLDRTRVSEALSELADMRLVIKFERDAIIGEKHTLYVATPFGSEVLSINEKLGRLQSAFPGTVLDFGDGIAHILKYYMEIDALKVTHETIMTRKGRKVSLKIMREPCKKKNCEITCDPIIKNVVRKFGEINKYEREPPGEKCRFSVTFWYKERGS